MTLPDAAARARAETDTEASFLVEASAGTGKTTTLIRRIVHLVLGGVPLREIAAMTFTEKAAGEMKTRLREALDEILSRETVGVKRERALRATFDLDAAEISTIHAFCGRLLRERPVEAGVDPDFVAGDEWLAADLADEVFRGWIDRAARRDPGPVADALRAGVSPQAIHDLALALHERRIFLADATLPVDAREEVREAAARLRLAYEQILPSLSSKESSEKRSRVEEVVAELGVLGSAPDESPGRTEPDLTIDLKGKWPEEAKEAIRRSRPEIESLTELLSALPVVPVLTALVDEIRSSFFLEIEEAKRHRGLLDFDDLLLSARELLRTSRAAREHFHRKYRTFVVDEFQDTDPVQVEILTRLAASPDRQEAPWRDLMPEAGRLFAVGDPKQSIYRFRRADIETYAEAADRLPEDQRLLLTSNFRSAQPLLDFVNAVGPTLLPPPGDHKYAVGYAPLTPSDRTKPGHRPAVLFLKPPPSDGERAGLRSPAGKEADAEEAEDLHVREQEARAVANLLATRLQRGERPWSRIAVLVPRHATVELLETALREAGIPFVLEGGKSFYKREEIAAVVQALKAIDDPSDAVAVVAALKSLLFGISDRVLLDAAEAGAKFDDPATIEESSPLFPSMQLLLSLHRQRHARPVAATIARLLAERQTLAAIGNEAVVHPVQGLANIERLFAFAGELDREGLSFREAVARLVRRTSDEAPEPAAFAEETDAVRLMTLHRAKGLEFDVVVLADLGLKEMSRPRQKPVVVCERAGGRFGVRLRFRGRTVGSARLTEVEAAEKERLEAEARRLLYVGLTRARETLVISWFRGKGGLEKSSLHPLAPFETAPPELGPLVEVVEADLSPPVAPSVVEEAPVTIDIVKEMTSAEGRLARLRSTASRPLRRAGERKDEATFSPEDVAPADRDEAPDRARRIGVAVHATMEALMAGKAPPDSGARDLAERRAFEELFEDERREARALVGALLSLPVVARALAARRRFAELPLLYRDDSLPETPIVEGKIDLLFEEADGWQIVDWKTDRVDTPEALEGRRELYAPQLKAYEDGLRKLLGSGARVKPGLLVFARGAKPTA